MLSEVGKIEVGEIEVGEIEVPSPILHIALLLRASGVTPAVHEH